jgi:hypothetical protein
MHNLVPTWKRNRNEALYRLLKYAIPTFGKLDSRTQTKFAKEFPQMALMLKGKDRLEIYLFSCFRQTAAKVDWNPNEVGRFTFSYLSSF